MNKLMKNKYFAGVLVFAVFQWLAYSAFTGSELTDSERRRSKTRALEKGLDWLTETIGQIPAALLLSGLGFVLAYVAYKRVERMIVG